MAATLPAVVGAAIPPPLASLTGVPSGWVSHVTPVPGPTSGSFAGVNARSVTVTVPPDACTSTSTALPNGPCTPSAIRPRTP